MADGAVTFLLQNLKDLVVHQIELSRAAKDELDWLQKELEMMNAVLEDAAGKFKGKAFATWEKQIREVVYEADDLIDSYIIQEQTKKRVGSTSKRIDIAEKMRNLRIKRIEPIFRTAMSNLSLLPPSEPRTNKIRTVDPLLDKTVVGFEDAIETLISCLREDSPGVEAISIIGMPGLGKTTVASKIYRDSSIDFGIPTKIWVNVSDEYSPRDIYLPIVKNFTNQDLSNFTDSELATKAREHLGGVKFLLVVDDVWTEKAWNDIKRALPVSNGSGKVLITSRSDKVAFHANPNREPHRLRFLTQEESWKLLQLEVYHKEGVWPSDLVAIGKTISDKCGGLPLALVVIGGILLDKIYPRESTKSEWTQVAQKFEQYLFTNDQEKEKNMKDIIALSYDKMPYHLKDCFLYFGVYPNDFDISAWKLIRLWIAEGFIKEENGSGRSLEDIAEENLKELIRRNLVMVGRRNAQGKVKSCRVHDMIREFCKKLAGFDQSNFLQVISKSTEGVFMPEVSKVADFRRVCLHSHFLDFLKENPVGPRTRSFICFSKHETDAEPNSLQSIVEAFKLLRVFEGSSIKFPRFHTKLNKLIHLRYITLAGGDEFRVLPSNIVALCNLQTFVIDTSYHTFEIKANISGMRKLRHLKTRAAIILNDNKECSQNTTLITLTRLSTESCKDEVLSKVPNLQALGIYGYLVSLANSSCLRQLSFLKKLKMINGVPSQKPVLRLLDAALFPPNLRSLTLSATNLDWSYMSTLGNLELEVLKLKDNAFKGDKWRVGPNEFGCLHSLQIERSDLSIWTVEDGCFRELRYLYLNYCMRLVAIPRNIAKSLQILDLGSVSDSAKSSAQEIALEKQKTPGESDGFNLIIALDKKK